MVNEVRSDFCTVYTVRVTVYTVQDLGSVYTVQDLGHGLYSTECGSRFIQYRIWSQFIQYNIWVTVFIELRIRSKQGSATLC